MKEYYGKSASGGIALGKIKKIQKKSISRKQCQIANPVLEKKRVQLAICTVSENLNVLYEEAMEKGGKENADIFAMHQRLVRDKDYVSHIDHCIEENKESAESAVQSALNKFSHAFMQMQDEYMKARAIDIRDISRQLIDVLTGQEDHLSLKEPCILVAKDLTPSQIMKLKKDMVLGFVVKFGSTNSHTAILARMLELPAILGVDFQWEEIEDNAFACVNGNNGAFVIDPNEETIEKMKTLEAIEKQEKEL